MTVAISFIGCAKTPEKIVSPSIKIDINIVENKEVYILSFSGGIRNENNDVAFEKVKGEVRLIDGDGRAVCAIPFEVPVILPLDTGVLDLRIDKNETEIGPILSLLNVNRETLQEERTSSGNFIDEKNIELDDLIYKKRDVVELLEEKVSKTQ